jgi:rod shape-determining protein MreD
MRWLTFAILASIGLVFQTALAPHVAIRGIRPDWMLSIAVFYALLGTWPDACIAAWTLGLLTDLASANEHIGLFAFSYGGTAWLILKVRDLIFPEHWRAHAALTLFAALLVYLVAAGYRALTHGAALPSLRSPWMFAIWTAVYTTAWAPILHYLLVHLKRLTGLEKKVSGRFS